MKSISFYLLISITLLACKSEHPIKTDDQVIENDVERQKEALADETFPITYENYFERLTFSHPIPPLNSLAYKKYKFDVDAIAKIPFDGKGDFDLYIYNSVSGEGEASMLITINYGAIVDGLEIHKNYSDKKETLTFTLDKQGKVTLYKQGNNYKKVLQEYQITEEGKFAKL